MFSKKTMAAFSTKYHVDESTGCWVWTASCTRGGYGQFNVSIEDGKKWYRAHRFSYEAHKGEIADGMVVMHTCDNPKCVNPDHLRLGSQAENIADRDTKGRGNWASIHSPKFQEIVLASNESNRTLAKRLGCSPAHIWKIRQGRYAWQKNRAGGA